jgi:AraC-like DNA-binding protein
MPYSCRIMRTVKISTLCDLAERLRVKQRRRRAASRRHHTESLGIEFPFFIGAFRAHNDSLSTRPSKTERLDLIMPLDGSLQIHIKGQVVKLSPGQILIVENPIVSIPADARHGDICVVLISFFPGFVYSLGSPLHDYFFLLPFYTNRDPKASIVRERSSLYQMHRIIARLLRCYLERPTYFEIGCKAFFLELLYRVAQSFHTADILESEATREKERRAKLEPVLAFVARNYPRLITLKEVASRAKMSVPQFVRLFRRVAGMSFVSYLTHVRLSHAVRLLKESSLAVAVIANEVGFADQSYFNRRFRAAFGRTPREVRQSLQLGRTKHSKIRSDPSSCFVREGMLWKATKNGNAGTSDSSLARPSTSTEDS